MPKRDLLAIVESVYDLEGRTELAWLSNIAESVSRVLGRQQGAYGLTYNASDTSHIRFSKLAMVGVSDPKRRLLLTRDCQRAYQDAPDLVDAIFRHVGYAPSRKLPSQDRLAEVHQKLAACGIHEILGINGVNLDGRGAHIGVLLERPAAKLKSDVLARVSTHLAAGYRLRSRLGDLPAVEHAEAILEPSGKMTHAIREAKIGAARAKLSAAAVRLDRIRASRQRSDPERALGAWRALVDGRWSLVDHFESDGRRFVLAHRNDSEVGPFELLTERERQVVANAALGQSNKMIGYELGIACSTVGVLMSRAAKKIGAASRRKLIGSYERHRERIETHGKR